MNSPFVVQQAKRLLERPDFKAARDEEQRLRLLYQLAFQRDPTSEEINLATASASNVPRTIPENANRRVAAST